MGTLYENITKLCKERGIKGYKLCKDTGLTPSILTDLKMGRKQGLSAKTADKIAEYLGVSVNYLLTGEQKTPTDGERTITDDDIKFALFGGDGEITDDMYQEVRNFAGYVKQREVNKKKE